MFQKASNNHYVSAASMLASANSSILIVDNTDRQRLINQALNPSYYPINPNSDSDILHKSYMQQEQYIAQDVANRNDVQEHGEPADTPPSPPLSPPPSPRARQGRPSQPPPPSTPQRRGQEHHTIQAHRSDPSAARDQQSMMQNAARPTYVNGRRVRTQQEQSEHDRDLTQGLEAYQREAQRNHEHDLRNPHEVRHRALTGLSRTAYEARQARLESMHGITNGNIASTSGTSAQSLLDAATEAGRSVETQHQLFQRHDSLRRDLVSRSDAHMREQVNDSVAAEGSLRSNRLAMNRDMNIGASHIQSVNHNVAGIAHPARPATDMGAGPSYIRRSPRGYHEVIPYTTPHDASTAMRSGNVYPPPAGISSTLARVLAPSSPLPSVVRATNRSTPHEYRAGRDEDGKNILPDHPSREDLSLPVKRLVRRKVSPDTLQSLSSEQVINPSTALVIYGENIIDSSSARSNNQ